MADAERNTQDYISQLERQIQIEAALERVRARSMAMHHTREIADVISVVCDQLCTLGFDIENAWITIFQQEKTAFDLWRTVKGKMHPYAHAMPIAGNPHFESNLEAWERGDPVFSFELSHEEAREFNKHMVALWGDPAFESNSMDEASYVFIDARHKYGTMGAGFANEPPLEFSPIIQRFACVFEQTYTRFLDLQKAEALARKTRQQASLDRVRGEIASMRTAEDLQRVTPLIWRELTTLGVPFFRCGVFIMDDEAKSIQSFMTTPTGEHLADITIPYDSASPTMDVVESWRCCEVYTDRWNRQQFIEWSNTMLAQGKFASPRQIPDVNEPPEWLSLHFVPFTQGMLYVGSDTPLSDEQINLVQSLADTFSVAYARYDDFQALESKNEELAITLSHLEATQAQLVQSEKMAALGQLTAGIAHEIKNPLNFVNNFSQISIDMLEELSAWIEENGEEDEQEIFQMLMMNVRKIKQHGERADNIVTSMMQHARAGSGKRGPVAINLMIEEYISLAFHGLRGKNAMGYSPIITRDYAPGVGEITIKQQEIGQVLINLLNNAFDAMREKSVGDNAYTPELTIATRRLNDAVQIRISDNGPGIPNELRDKIFEPFFTTKSPGEGTGLGLSLSYDIVTNGHGGTLIMKSEEGLGATFILSLPA